jgi:hypothetical protein
VSFDGHGVVVRGRRWLLWLGGVLEAIAVVVLARHLWDWHYRQIIVSGLAFTVGNTALLLYPWSARKWPRRLPVRVRADADGLRVDSWLIRRGAIVAGYLLAAPERAVRLVRARRFSAPLDLELGTREAAVELVEALGLGIRHATARFQAVYGGLVRRQLVAAGAIIGFFALSMVAMILADHLTGRGLPPGFNMLFILFPSLLLSLGPAVLRTTIDVGADGIWLSKGNTFVPYAELLQVTIENADLVLVRKSHGPLRLGFGGTEQQNEARAACMKRIEEARAAFAMGEAAVHPVALLAPDGRSAVGWMKALRSVAGYRSSAVPKDTLLRIVEDASAASPVRAGAAVALARDLDDDSRKRLRVVAQTCAAPRLRVALELVADGDQADEIGLEGALEAVLKEARRDSSAGG